MLAGEVVAVTPEQLMRSRYTAFAVGDEAHLLASWHPATRPAAVGLDPGQRWTRLEVLAAPAAGLFDVEGEVEFRAHGTPGAVHERSRFVRERGRWLYVDGVPGR